MANPTIDFDYARSLLGDQVNPMSSADWIKKRLGIELWSKQREIVDSLQKHKKVAVQSGHGIGKSLTASVIATHWVATHPPDETLVVTTAPSRDQVSAIMWEYIRNLHRKGKLAGEVQRSDRWLIGDTLVGFGRKPQDYDRHAFQGLHRKYVLLIIDEACGIDEWLWIAGLAITTGDNCRILAIGNPDDPASYFAKVCQPNADWHNIKISVFDSPNFTGEKVSKDLAENVTGLGWVKEMESEVGIDTPLWKSKVLGEFPEESETSVIPMNWIYEAQNRWLAWKDTTGGEPDKTQRHVVGADIARFGRDKTVFAHRYGDIITKVDVMPKVDTVQTAHLLMSTMGGKDLAVIDTNGVGAGVFDTVRKSGYRSLGFNAGTRTSLTDRSGQIEFYNLRAAVFWRLREALDPSRGSTICLPITEHLAQDLSVSNWRTAAGGKLVIESKDDIKKRIGRSPDQGDAVAMAFWAANLSAKMTINESSFSWRDPSEFEDDVALPWEEQSDIPWELV